MTTHSTEAICELTASELCIVRTKGGETSVKSVAGNLQALVRSVPEAFLARRVIVCEGKTEVGVLRAMDKKWSKDDDGRGLAFYGAMMIDGGGRTNAPQKAIQLANLGYEVILFADSDEPIEPPKPEVEAVGASVVLWADNLNTEARICQDIPWDTVQRLLELATEIFSAQSIRGQIAACIGCKETDIASSVMADWVAKGLTHDQIREGIAKAAHKNKWFKNTTLGEQVGDLVATGLPDIPETDLYKKLNEIHQWSIAT